MRRVAFFAVSLAAVAHGLCPSSATTGGTQVNVLEDAGSVPANAVQTVWSPLNEKHVFVVHQTGVIYVRSSDGLDLAVGGGSVLDISTEVYSWHDRGLLSAVFHPDYGTTNNFMYLFYTKQPVPAWPDDTCTITGPDDARNYCMANGAIRRITVDPVYQGGKVVSYSQATLGPILVEGWCGSSMTHHIGTMAFLSDKSMVLAAGEGSQALGALDYGYSYDKCTLPGNTNMPQGAFRSQRMDSLSGKALRFAPGPLVTSGGELQLGSDYWIMAKGLRNPFRLTVHPVTGDVYIGDVGSSGVAAKEEINLIPDPTTDNSKGLLRNFGWPCMEGTAPNFEVQTWLASNPQMDDVGCGTIWAGKDPLYTGPVFMYRDTSIEPLDPDQAHACEPGGSTAEGAISGLDVYETGPLASILGGKLVVSDYAKQCVFYFDNDGSGSPDFTSHHVLTEGGLWSDVKYAPDGLLYLVSWSGTNAGVLQIASVSNVVVPTANLFTTPNPADVSEGQALHFDASGSQNGDGSAMKNYQWDFDGDGNIDKTTASPMTSYTYSKKGVYHASVIATNKYNASACTETTVLVGITTSISMTPATGTWAVGDYINFGLSVAGADVTDADVTWTLTTQHCMLDRCLGEAKCHSHADNLIGGNTGLKNLKVKPISHEMPSYVMLSASIKIGSDVAVRSFTSVATTYDFVVSTSPPGFALYSGESGQLCQFSNPPCDLSMMAQNNLAVGVQRVQAFNSGIWGFSKWETTMSGKTVDSTDSQVTSAATSDGTIVAVFEQVKVKASTALEAPANFKIEPSAFETLTATWDAVDNADYYVVYLQTTTANGLAHIPATVYPQSVTVAAAPQPSVDITVPDGQVDYVASVAALNYTLLELGPKSAEVTVRSNLSTELCTAQYGVCVYPDGDPCTLAVPSETRNTGLGGFYDSFCLAFPTLVGCYGNGCRACTWDRCLYSKSNGNADPGYLPDCPLCVANAYGKTKSKQTCAFASSDGVAPNQDLSSPQLAPAGNDALGDYQVELTSCLIGAAPADYSAGNSKGEGASDAATVFQNAMAEQYNYTTIVSSVGSCNGATFSRRRLAASASQSGTQLTYSLVAVDSKANGDAVAEDVINQSDDGSLALALEMAGLLDVTKVITSTSYTIGGYDDGSSGSSGGSKTVVIAVACAVAAVVAVAVGAGFMVRRRRQQKSKGGSQPKVAPSAT